jgi:hypothetical protein
MGGVDGGGPGLGREVGNEGTTAAIPLDICGAGWETRAQWPLTLLSSSTCGTGWGTIASNPRPLSSSRQLDRTPELVARLPEEGPSELSLIFPKSRTHVHPSPIPDGDEKLSCSTTIDGVRRT